MKKVIYVLCLATIFTLLTGIIPHPKQSLCISDVDCGSARNESDIAYIYTNGYPFTAYSKKVSYEPMAETGNLDEIILAKWYWDKILVNFLFYTVFAVLIVILISVKNRNNENSRH